MNKNHINKKNTRDWVYCNEDSRAEYHRNVFINEHGGEFTHKWDKFGGEWTWSEKKTSEVPEEVKEKKRYILTDLKGNEYITENLSKFCRDNDLNKSAIFKVLSGERSHHKGYRVRKEGE